MRFRHGYQEFCLRGLHSELRAIRIVLLVFEWDGCATCPEARSLNIFDIVPIPSDKDAISAIDIVKSSGMPFSQITKPLNCGS